MAPASPMASNSTQAVLTLIFGATATGISIITVWQGYRFSKTWQGNHIARDIEENHTIHHGINSSISTSTPTQLDSTTSIAFTVPAATNRSPAESFELAAIDPVSPTAPTNSGANQDDT